MTVAAVQLQPVVDVGVASDRVLEREDQQRRSGAAHPRRPRRRLPDRRNTPACRPTRSRRRLRCCLAGIPSTRPSSARRRHACPSPEPACPRRDRRRSTGAHRAPRAGRTVPCRSRHPAHRGCFDGSRPNPPASPPPAPARGTTASRASIRSSAAKLSKVLSTNPFDARAGTSRPGAGRQHVPRNRIARLFVEPFLEDLHRLVDLAQRAVRQRQQLSRFAVLRPERDHLAVARGRFLGSFQPVQQDAEVGVGVDVLGIQLDGRAIRGFRFDRLSGRPQQHAEIAVRVGVARDRWRSPVDRRRSRRRACRPTGRRCRGCCSSPPRRARAQGSAR